jgi:hypothetical protein
MEQYQRALDALYPPATIVTSDRTTLTGTLAPTAPRYPKRALRPRVRRFKGYCG